MYTPAKRSLRRSERKVIERMLNEECEEIINHPEAEKSELKDFFIRDGWSEELSTKMVEEAARSRSLMHREMAYRELNVSPDALEHPAENGMYMFAAYIVGGLIPLSAYFFVTLPHATYISIAVTLFGLFLLGASISRFTKEKWYATGAHMLIFGGIALAVGFLVGTLSEYLPM